MTLEQSVPRDPQPMLAKMVDVLERNGYTVSTSSNGVRGRFEFVGTTGDGIFAHDVCASVISGRKHCDVRVRGQTEPHHYWGPTPNWSPWISRAIVQMKRVVDEMAASVDMGWPAGE